jgi:putative Mg2+ transporter-C (MgtC) family protein
MGMEPGTFSPEHITWTEAGLRMACAIVLPFVIGMERFLRKKPIDFRPFVIISVAACGLSIASLELVHKTFDSQLVVDPTRTFEGVVTGIGFLGAGAMFREDNFVQGAGSAAAIWGAGAIGIVCGIGSLWLAALIALPIFAVLVLSAPFIGRYDPSGEERKD